MDTLYDTQLQIIKAQEEQIVLLSGMISKLQEILLELKKSNEWRQV